MNDAPQPLVPAEVDLRGLPFMPLDVVRLMDSDLFALSTGDEFKAALSLWCRSWLQVPAASLPNDDRILAHLSGTSTRWKKVKAMALRGWVLCQDGRWYHPVVAEKALEAWKHRVAQRERAQRRWHGTGNATALPTAHAEAHATASATAMQGTGTGTVKGQKSREGASIEPPTPRRAVPVGTRLPPDFALPEDWKAWALQEQKSWTPDHCQRVSEKFADHWRAAPGSRGVKLDWQATWRNWVRNEGAMRPDQKPKLTLTEVMDREERNAA